LHAARQAVRRPIRWLSSGRWDWLSRTWPPRTWFINERSNSGEARRLPDIFDCAVVGAGVFGSWIAYELRRAGKSVLLIDAHGAANSRASSGGESRIIRMSYGPDEIYTRWSLYSLTRWQEFFSETNQPGLFHRTGVLWTA